MPASLFNKESIYILDAVRTAVASPFKSLKDFSAGQLGGYVIVNLLKRQNFNPALVDEVIFGNTVMAGNGQNSARQASIRGGLLPSTTAYTVNNVCGAGLQSVILAGQAIYSGTSQCVIAGGSESASRTPQLFSKLVETPFDQRDPVDSLLYDGLWCALSGKHMGELCEKLAGKAKITRKMQDRYSLESHRKAAIGKFNKEIIRVPFADGKFFCVDERIRRRVGIENFETLPPAFVENGTITSGNSSVPSDGSAGVCVVGENFVRTQKVKPLARILGYASIAVEPQLTFSAGVPAIEVCLKTCNLKLKDIDLFEVSEAFSAQAIFTRDTLNIPSDKINIYGGDIALGHPLGAAGARILVTLVHALQTEGKKLGMAAICYGGGGAMAMIIENLQ
ncbi:MAG: thiolase family protein [Candidatus Omnitrophica bacterium]|nr:thiolase family protein [Candidatus Omnitrophota bacterium]